MPEVIKLSLGQHFNSIGFSLHGKEGLTNIEYNGKSYPKEEVVNQIASGSPKSSDFDLRAMEGSVCQDNIECSGQRIDVPKGKYAAVLFLGSSMWQNHMGYMDLHYAGEPARRALLKLSTWHNPAKEFVPKFGETEFMTFTHMHDVGEVKEYHKLVIWLQRLELESQLTLEAITLPDDCCMHIFAMSLEKAKA